MLRPAIVLLSAVFFGLAVPVWAADPAPAATDLSQVDGDFAFQGEYAGAIRFQNASVEEVGLQVVALGKGQFSAILYQGGLPGAGWNREVTVKFQGSSSGGRVTFAKFPTRITVDGSSAVVSDDSFSLVQGHLGKTVRQSPTMGAAAPYGATVLFNGTGTEHFEEGRMTDDGLLIEGTQLKKAYRNFSLHLEFRLPYMPQATNQGRGNSGVYLQSRYEVQILDSFGLEPVHNSCGALYKLKIADLNMSLPPLTWQTYDIDFTAAKFDDKAEKTQNARLTVRHNGVVIHNDVEIERKTGAGKPEGPNPLPIKLQDHRNPVRFRNIWIIDHGNCPPPKCECSVSVCE